MSSEMTSFNPALWFVCRLCRQTFGELEELKKHKLESHLSHCDKIKCIIFEERLLGQPWVPLDDLYSINTMPNSLANYECSDLSQSLHIDTDDSFDFFPSFLDLKEKGNSNLGPPNHTPTRRSSLLALKLKIFGKYFNGYRPTRKTIFERRIKRRWPNYGSKLSHCQSRHKNRHECESTHQHKTESNLEIPAVLTEPQPELSRHQSVLPEIESLLSPSSSVCSFNRSRNDSHNGSEISYTLQELIDEECIVTGSVTTNLGDALNTPMVSALTEFDFDLFKPHTPFPEIRDIDINADSNFMGATDIVTDVEQETKTGTISDTAGTYIHNHTSSKNDLLEKEFNVEDFADTNNNNRVGTDVVEINEGTFKLTSGIPIPAQEVYSPVFVQISPKVSPKVSPNVSPNVSLKVSPKASPNFAPKASPNFCPKVSPNVSANVSPKASPNVFTKASQKYFPKASPNFSPKVSPKVSPSSSPKATPQLSPQVSSRVSSPSPQISPQGSTLSSVFSKLYFEVPDQQQPIILLNNDYAHEEVVEMVESSSNTIDEMSAEVEDIPSLPVYEVGTAGSPSIIQHEDADQYNSVDSAVSKCLEGPAEVYSAKPFLTETNGQFLNYDPGFLPHYSSLRERSPEIGGEFNGPAEVYSAKPLLPETNGQFLNYDPQFLPHYSNQREWSPEIGGELEETTTNLAGSSSGSANSSGDESSGSGDSDRVASKERFANPNLRGSGLSSFTKELLDGVSETDSSNSGAETNSSNSSGDEARSSISINERSFRTASLTKQKQSSSASITKDKEPQSSKTRNQINHHKSLAFTMRLRCKGTKEKRKLNSRLTGNDRYCKTCDKTFRIPSLFEVHKLIHHTVNRPIFKCKKCSKEFRDKKCFRRHEKSHSAKAKKIVKNFKCTVKICPASFSNRHQLRQHMECHSTDKPYVCHKCQFKTKHKRVLQRHFVRHGKPTPHKCRFCSKPFAHKSLLDNHERTHTGQRPFKCQVKTCGLTFMSKDTLSLHTRVKHFKTLGLEEFSCSFCKKRTSFGVKRLLEKHIKIHHSKHKPFRCNHPGCTKEYNEKRSLVEHMTLHSGETLFECEDCGLRFRSRTQLRRHRQKDCQD